MFNKLIEATHNFLQKCDIGKAKSTETYAELTEALKDPRILAYKAIDTERNFQDRQWGSDKRHDVGAWILLMEEACLKARQAWYNAKGDQEALERVRVIGSLAVCCMEHNGAYERIEQQVLAVPAYTKIWIVTYKVQGQDYYIARFDLEKKNFSPVACSISREQSQLYSLVEANEVAKILQAIEDEGKFERPAKFEVVLK